MIKPAACAAALLGVAASFAVRAEVTAAPSPGTRAAVQQAIEHQLDRRRVAIGTMIAGGVAIVGGGIASDVAWSQNRREGRDGQPHTHNVYVPYAIGLGVGLPLLGVGGYLFADAQHRLGLLREQRVLLSYQPETHQPVLRLAFGF